tara:strand:- start:1644 stop:1766 length:123 start_codon:yes stop_codon:yes gene_type:complete
MMMAVLRRSFSLNKYNYIDYFLHCKNLYLQEFEVVKNAKI